MFEKTLFTFIFYRFYATTKTQSAFSKMSKTNFTRIFSVKKLIKFEQLSSLLHCFMCKFFTFAKLLPLLYFRLFPKQVERIFVFAAQKLYFVFNASCAFLNFYTLASSKIVLGVTQLQLIT
jgi:hypothetical protein